MILLLLAQDQFNYKCSNLQGKVAETVDDLMNGVQWLQETTGPAILEIKVCPGSRKDLGRPTRSPIQNKVDFMNFLSLNAYE
jgi:phosphonopyruvate decarboxylase